MKSNCQISRIACYCGLVVVCLATTVSAQEWAEKLFKEKTHEFGSVARAAKVEYAFEMVNPYKEDLHITGVRASCGCTLPRIQKDTLKSWEKGAIIAEFNTRAFSGQRGARDYRDASTSRSTPKSNCKSTATSAPTSSSIRAKSHWARCPPAAAPKNRSRSIMPGAATGRFWASNRRPLTCTPTCSEVSRKNGRVAYKLAVSLDRSAPPGYVADELILRTNDRRSPQFPVKVEGYVVADLTVSPSSLMLGILQPGQKITKQIVVKGKQPFHVLGIDCENGSFSFPSRRRPKRSI